MLCGGLLRSSPFYCSPFCGGFFCGFAFSGSALGDGGFGLEGTQRCQHLGSKLVVMRCVRIVWRIEFGSVEWAGRLRLACCNFRRVLVTAVVLVPRRGVPCCCIHLVVRLRLVDHVRYLRFGIHVAQRGDLLSQAVQCGQLRLGRIELLHGLIDHIGGPGEQVLTIGGQGLADRAQAFQQAFKRRQQLGQGLDVDHRDGPVQGMHGAQQLFADGQLGTGTLQGGSDGLQILRDLAAQDLQQHRIHRWQHRPGDDRGRRLRYGFADRCAGIGMAGFGHGCCRHRHAGWHAPAHYATYGFGGAAQMVLKPGGMACGELLGNVHDGADRHLRLALALERGEQRRQRVDGVANQRLHRRIGLDAVVEHAVEHVLDFPGELAQHACADQSPGAFQRMERAADVDERGVLRRIGEPDFFGSAQVVDFFLHLLQENLADVVVDALGVGIELGMGGQRVTQRHLFEDFFLDLDPVGLGRVGVGGKRDRWRGGLRIGQAQAIEIMRQRDFSARLSDDEIAQIVAGQHADRLAQLRVDLLFQRVHIRQRHNLNLHGWRLDSRAGGRHRPVAEHAEAVLGHVENVFEATAMLAGCLQVIFQGCQGIGQMIHLRAAGNTPVSQQLVPDEATHAIGQLGRARGRHHAHGTGHLLHELRRAEQLLVLPAGFDEGDDGVLHLGGVADRLLHQRADHTQRLAARQALHGWRGAGVLLGAEALDVIVQRGFDIQQRAGNVEQGLLVGSPHVRHDFAEHAPLLVDDAPRHGQCQHAQGVADALQHLPLRRELRRIRTLLAQEQVQRLLHPQQVVLQRTRYGIEQRTVVAGYRTTGVLQLARLGHQAVECIRAAQQLHLRAALARLRHDVEQLAGHLVGFTAAQAVLALLDELANETIHLADQLAHFGRLAGYQALLKPLQHPGGYPPEPAAMHVVAAGGDGQQRLAHAGQLLGRVLPAKPAQHLLLEAQAQVDHLAAVSLRISLAHGGRRLLRHERIEVGMEHRRFGQRRHFAAAAQVVEQRQQHHRHIAVAAGEALQIIGQLHQTAHQRGIGLLAVHDGVAQQCAGDRLHLGGHHGRAIELHHLQGAVDLMQMVRAGAHEIAPGGIVYIGFQRIAGDRQRLVELRPDPLQGGEIDVVLKSHAPVSAIRTMLALCAPRDCPPSECLCRSGRPPGRERPGAAGPFDVNPAT